MKLVGYKYLQMICQQSFPGLSSSYLKRLRERSRNNLCFVLPLSLEYIKWQVSPYIYNTYVLSLIDDGTISKFPYSSAGCINEEIVHSTEQFLLYYDSNLIQLPIDGLDQEMNQFQRHENELHELFVKLESQPSLPTAPPVAAPQVSVIFWRRQYIEVVLSYAMKISAFPVAVLLVLVVLEQYLGPEFDTINSDIASTFNLLLDNLDIFDKVTTENSNSEEANVLKAGLEGQNENKNSSHLSNSLNPAQIYSSDQYTAGLDNQMPPESSQSVRKNVLDQYQSNFLARETQIFSPEPRGTSALALKFEHFSSRDNTVDFANKLISATQNFKDLNLDFSSLVASTTDSQVPTKSGRVPLADKDRRTVEPIDLTTYIDTMSTKFVEKEMGSQLLNNIAKPSSPNANSMPIIQPSDPEIIFLDGIGGQTLWEIDNPTRNVSLIITNFGGVGLGSQPSNLTRKEIDTIKFNGTNFAATNLLLLQKEDDLIIGFYGSDLIKITIKNFKRENFDNLGIYPVNGLDQPIGLGNILFNQDSKIQDNIDVFNDDWQKEQVFSKNKITFLNDQNNTIKGFDNSDDVINGLGGDDVIFGLGGNDILRGDGGDDILWGGEGNNQSLGGSGADLFGLSENGFTKVLDFNIQEDKILLSNNIQFQDLVIESIDSGNAYGSRIRFNNQVLLELPGIYSRQLNSSLFVTSYIDHKGSSLFH
jgi:hypothetical protein